MRRVLVVTVIAVCGVAGVVIAVVSNRSDGPDRVFREAIALRGRLKPVKILHLRPTRKFPRVSIDDRRQHNREPLNEPSRAPTRAAGAQTDLVRSSSVAPTIAGPLQAAPKDEDLARFEWGRFTGGDAAFATEPSVAAHGSRVLETWNWGAALSSDAGRSFTFVDPTTAFPDAHDGFCCDQVAYYVPKWDLWVWLLQYFPDENGNILRIAVARGDSAFDAARSNASTLKLIDLSPRSFGWPASAFFDFNGISSTDKNLFVATNVATNSRYEGAVIRIPLSELASASVKLKDALASKTFPLQTPRLVQGAGDTMYFASHKSAAVLRVWNWKDDSASIGHLDVSHSTYVQRRPYECGRIGGPPTSDWCSGFRDGQYKNNDSVLAGWTAKGRVGFAWNAGQDRSAGFPYPFVMAAELHEDTMELAAEPLIWSPHYAYQYPAITPNARGDLGGIVSSGGGEAYESCTGIIRDPVEDRSRSGWEARILDSSDADAAKPQAGDYLGISPAGPASNTWAGGCMTLRGGGERKNVATGYYAFGRKKDGPG